MAEQPITADNDPWDDDTDLDNLTPEQRGDVVAGEEEDDPTPPKEEPAAKKGEEEEKPEAKKEEEEPEAKKEEEEPEVKKADEPEGKQQEQEEELPAYMVPKHRYDTARQRASEAERRLAELERKLNGEQQQPQQSQQEPDVDYDAQLSELDSKHAKALADGDYEAAAKFSTEARKLEREMYVNEITQRTQTATYAAREASRLDSAIDEVYARHPVLDPDSGTFDQEKTNEVLRLQSAFSNSGYSAADALHEAVKYAFHEPEMVEAPQKPKPEAPEKRKTDVQRNLKTAENQPPDLKSAGEDSDSAGVTETLPDPASLTEEEFDALPEATLRKMRGDIF